VALSELLAGGELRLIGTLVVAAILGAGLGAERELAEKPAGLRTHILVAVAAALIVGLGDTLVDRFGADRFGELVRADPIRLMEAVVTGVSFLGAGTILRRDRGGIEGLTTAASLLLTAAIGSCVALSLWVLAVGATLLGVTVLRLIRRFEERVLAKRDRVVSEGST
jgi:putative Mg2+ transporter-C (MgtC) family protein